MHKPALTMLSLYADSRNTPNNSVFSADAHADTKYALALLLQQLLLCCWKEQQESNGAYSALLLHSYEWLLKYHFLKCTRYYKT